VVESRGMMKGGGMTRPFILGMLQRGPEERLSNEQGDATVPNRAAFEPSQTLHLLGMPYLKCGTRNKRVFKEAHPINTAGNGLGPRRRGFEWWPPDMGSGNIADLNCADSSTRVVYWCMGARHT